MGLNGQLSNPQVLNGTLSNEILRGYSAYQIAVMLGFEGTEAEWIESLRGGGQAEPGGYYTLDIINKNEDTIIISFIPSEPHMDAIPPKEISLPRGKDGKDGSNGSDGVGILSIEQTTTSTEDGGENVVTVTLTNGQESTFTVRNGSQGNPGTGGGGDIEPMEDDIPKVFFDKAIPQTKDDAVTKFRYISKTQDVSGYAEFKAQGNSSMQYPKKNMTVKMYKDESLEESLKIDFKGWGKQKKHVYKANWIDLTHARNVVSARIWGDIVKSRTKYNELPELLRTSPNQGAVDGFPVKVYSQGIYQGRYTLNIPKDAWMANMNDDLDNHCILCSEGYISGCFRAEAKIDGSDWSDEVHENVPNSIKTRWNEVISFVMNSTDEEFKTNLSDYFLVDSLIDYLIFGMVSCGLDSFGKNQLFFTYDGIKWIASMYDMDATWGLHWDGTKIVASDYPRTRYEDYVSSNSNKDGNLLYIRLQKMFYQEIQERYAELKIGVLSVPNIINHFERFTDITPLDLVKEDYAITTGNGEFTNIPSQDTNNIQQIRQFVVERYVYCDKYFEDLTPKESNVVYQLPATTVFDGTNYIDTGIKLFDTDKDFSLFLHYKGSENNTSVLNKHVVMHCMYEAMPYDGIVYQIVDGKYSLNYNQWRGLKYQYNDVSEHKLIIVHEAGTKYASVLYDDGQKTTTFSDEGSNFEYTLLLGCFQSLAGVKGRFWHGTIYDCKVWNSVLPDAEIEELMK